MSFRGRGRGGGGFRGSRGGFGGGGRYEDQGPPEYVKPLGYFVHTAQDDLVCKVELEDVPYFNAPIYLEDKNQIGKIDEIFGNLRDFYVSIKLSDNMKASSFAVNQKLYINPAKLLPLRMFTSDSSKSGPKRGGRGARGGRGFGGGRGRGFGGGRGGGFGGGRGGGFGGGRGGGGRGGGRGFSRGGGGGYGR